MSLQDWVHARSTRKVPHPGALHHHYMIGRAARLAKILTTQFQICYRVFLNHPR